MGPSLPRQVRRDISREHGERVLAAQRDTQGRWQVGTDAALHLDTGDPQVQHVRWETVETLSWDADASTITVMVADGVEVRRTVVAFDGPGRLVELARERVDASFVARAHEKLDGARGTVTVVARRSPTRSGPVTFSYVLDRGLSSDDPEVRDATARALAVVRADLGLDGDAG
ncbi:hypothetical protein FE697_008425 [Mumia zhuanghuii]|uniref:Polyketide cyclase / dehydrase and lipid transport n=2 Tax=Mumia TaxID=1546255 RepID=A0ABW1QL59_9ACTN|nr:MULTISPECIES: hypothetical protein [Mumia]KAA1423606.1 hypothetical protein FE697_008425 [Mumia zhuanghuii]